MEETGEVRAAYAARVGYAFANHRQREVDAILARLRIAESTQAAAGSTAAPGTAPGEG